MTVAGVVLFVLQGPRLIEQSSELIHCGELIKISGGGWKQQRVVYLFDHQLVYCKRV